MKVNGCNFVQMDANLCKQIIEVEMKEKFTGEKNFRREHKTTADEFDLLGKDQTLMKVWKSLLPQDANFLPSQRLKIQILIQTSKLMKHRLATVWISTSVFPRDLTDICLLGTRLEGIA